MEKEVIHREKQILLSLLTLSLFAGRQSANKAEMEREEGSRVLVSNKTTCIIRKIQIQDSQESVILLNKSMKYLTNK